MGSSSFGLIASPTSLSLPAGATTGNTSTVTVAPIGSFTSTVDLACAVSGPSGATSPATCSLASSSAASGSGTDVVTIATTSTTTTGIYTVTVTGTSGAIMQTAVFDVTASAAIPATYTVAASAPAAIPLRYSIPF